MYAKFKDVATTEPRENTKYRIYNFFGRDPEGRAIEFQCFLHPLPEITDSQSPLVRSIKLPSFSQSLQSWRPSGTSGRSQIRRASVSSYGSARRARGWGIGRQPE